MGLTVYGCQIPQITVRLVLLFHQYAFMASFVCFYDLSKLIHFNQMGSIERQCHLFFHSPTFSLLIVGAFHS